MRRSSKRAPLALLVLCIGLASLVYWQVEHPPALPTGIAGAEGSSKSEPTGASRQAEYSFPPLADFSEIVARPLFSPSRRPPEEIEVSDTESGAVSDAPPPPMQSNFILAGVVISAEGRMVLLRRMNSTDLVRALLGQEIDGWSVERIESDRVTLRQGGTVEIVTLQDKAQDLPAQQKLRAVQNGQLDENQAQQ